MYQVNYQVIWYNQDGTRRYTWTCTDIDCSNFVGGYCHQYTLTVSTEGAVSDLAPVSDCKHGVTVKLKKSYKNAFIPVNELVIVGKQGNFCTKTNFVNLLDTLYPRIYIVRDSNSLIRLTRKVFWIFQSACQKRFLLYLRRSNLAIKAKLS